MSALDGLPSEGKIVVLAPEVAALAVEQSPEYADRIFTLPGIDPCTAFVVDLDAIRALTDDEDLWTRSGN